jgi:hypothetical protein
MRRISKKRLGMMKVASEWRESLKSQVSRCEFCLKPASASWLDCDEIARGSSRALALTAEYAILVVHRHCHDHIQNWPRARRLALLYLARPSDYDLEAFWELTSRRWPEQEDVDREIEQLLLQRSA